jgi:hypothetical protein
LRERGHGYSVPVVFGLSLRHPTKACLQTGFPNRSKIDSRLKNGDQP